MNAKAWMSSLSTAGRNGADAQQLPKHPATAVVERWNGSAWIETRLVWDGSSYVEVVNG